MTTKTELLAFFSPKGGSGKTTISTQCATSAKKYGKRVVFYDLDPQKTATFYFSRIDEKYRPDVILHDFNQAPPIETDFIMLDCEPSMRFIPPKEFKIIAPTLASSLDLHSYRKIFELEKKGYQVLRVLNQFSMVRNDDSEVRKQLEPCILISANSGIRFAMNNGKTIWNSNHPGGKRAKNQFNYLISRIVKGTAETLTDEEFSQIMILGHNQTKENK